MAEDTKEEVAEDALMETSETSAEETVEETPAVEDTETAEAEAEPEGEVSVKVLTEEEQLEEELRAKQRVDTSIPVQYKNKIGTFTCTHGVLKNEAGERVTAAEITAEGGPLRKVKTPKDKKGA